ncbi:helix-turn-helix transcriptional regulator [Clostridium sp. MD294]|uniref:helix-turn-helix domain-containing protein n=1 Tax=Clostridium sp. MD294 TaxID=97138 RepID=UPI0002CA0577|nr:HTH-type transcriptional activator Btr [Clostridium sp. MD294]
MLKNIFQIIFKKLNKIAFHIGISASYFSSIFKQKTGQSFVEYLTKTRMEKACELLKCTTLRTAEIGEQVGYHDPHYFSTTFKRVIGQSPKEFKNDSTNQQEK